MCRAILITIGILFIWAVFGLVVSTALRLPDDDVVGIGIILLIATSIWAGFDARKIEFKKYKTSLGSTVYGGGGVFAAVLVLWIVFFPWYLSSRGKILSGKAKRRDEYEGEALNGGEMMEENKEYQSMARQDAMAVLKSRRKKSKFWCVLGVITTGLILFCLFFRVVTFSNDFTVIAKKYPTFSDTFVDLEDYVKRSNDAVEEYTSDALNAFISESPPLEFYLRKHAIDPVVYNELWEKGLIVREGEDNIYESDIDDSRDVDASSNAQAGETAKRYLQVASTGTGTLQAQAMFNLGVLYETGQGVKKDYGQAIYWYKESAKRGYKSAQEKLVELGVDCSPGAKNGTLK